MSWGTIYRAYLWHTRCWQHCIRPKGRGHCMCNKPGFDLIERAQRHNHPGGSKAVWILEKQGTTHLAFACQWAWQQGRTGNGTDDAVWVQGVGSQFLWHEGRWGSPRTFWSFTTIWETWPTLMRLHVQDMEKGYQSPACCDTGSSVACKQIQVGNFFSKIGTEFWVEILGVEYIWGSQSLQE